MNIFDYDSAVCQVANRFNVAKEALTEAGAIRAQILSDIMNLSEQPKPQIEQTLLWACEEFEAWGQQRNQNAKH